MNEEITETSKAVQEVAKTANNFGCFIGKFISGPLEQVSGMVEDKLKYIRWENRLKLLNKAEKKLKELGLNGPDKTISIKLAAPLFQAASFEDDDYLQEMWAQLLVSSTTSTSNFELQRIYIDILEKLSSFDAKILEKIYSIQQEIVFQTAVITTKLPDEVEFNFNNQFGEEPSEKIIMSLLNLDRLDCVKIPSSWNGTQHFGFVNQTLLGKKFIEACVKNKGI